MLNEIRNVKKHIKEYSCNLLTLVLNAIISLSIIFGLNFFFSSEKTKGQEKSLYSPEDMERIKQLFGETNAGYKYVNIAIDFLGKKIASDFNAWVPIIVAFCLYGCFTLLIHKKQKQVEKTHALFYMQKYSLKTASTLLQVCFFILVFLIFGTVAFLFLALYASVSFEPFYKFAFYLFLYFLLTLGLFIWFKFSEAKIEEPYKDK